MCLSFELKFECGRCGGLIFNVLDSGSSGPCSSPGQGHGVVFLGKTLSLTVPLSQCDCKGNAGGNPVMNTIQGGVEILVVSR